MKNFLSALALLLLIASCQKEPDFATVDMTAKQQADTICNVIKGYAYDATGLAFDSTLYLYNGGRLVKSSFGDLTDSLEFVYTGNQITRRNYLSQGVVDEYDNIFYNADSTLQRIEVFATPFASPGQMVKKDSIVFAYTSGKLTKRTVYANAYGSMPFVRIREDLFTYSGNNATGLTQNEYDLSGSVTSFTVYAFTHDAQPNFIRKQKLPHLLLDPEFVNAQTEYFPFFLSENNVTSLAEVGNPSSKATFSYTANRQGYLLYLKQDGSPFISYQHLCQ